MELLRARGLTKSFNDQRVVDALDLDCESGKVLGLLGPNGAGKTTTLRMLYGFTRPDAGTVHYEGRSFDTHREQSKRMIGVCTQEDTLDYDFTVAQNLRVYASYFRPPVEALATRVDALIEQFGLARWSKASPYALSGGYKRRLLIARSIVHRPKVLFLDEPTTGLDPAARVDVWELVAQLRDEGMAIILTTHYMDESERLSDSLLVLQEGRAVARGSTARVLGEILGDHVLVLRATEPGHQPLIEGLRAQNKRAARVLGELRFAITAAQLAELSQRYPEVRLEVRPPNLDDLFLALAEEGEASERVPSGRVDP